MATEEIALKITTDASQTEKSVKSIKTELREAQQDAINLSRKFGDTSTEALQAAKRVANLRDEVADFKQRVDALNPDAKFRAFGQSLQGVAGGFAGLQGAIGLFGTESKDLEKQLLKVQSALALSQGLDAILESKEAFKNLKIVAVDAFKAIRAAIGSTGIGLLVIALGTIVAYWDDIKVALGGVSEEQQKLNIETEKNVKSQKDKLTQLDSQDEILKQQGLSEREILKLKEKQTAELIRQQIIQLETQKAAVDAETKRAASNFSATLGTLTKLGLQAGIATKISSMFFNPGEVAQKGKETVSELDKQLIESRNKLASYQNQIQQIDNNASKERIAKAKELEDKQTKKIIDDAKKKADQAAYEKQVEADTIADLAAQDAAALQAENDRLATDGKIKVSIAKATSDELINNQKAEAEAKQAINDAYLNTLGQFGNLVSAIAGKNKTLAIAGIVIEQAAAIGRIVSNTAVANAKAVAASPLTGGMPFVAINKVSAALGIASSIAAGAKAISQIKSAPGGSPSGGGSLPSGGGNIPGEPRPTQAPIAPSVQVTQASLMQGGNNVNVQNQGAVKAFVVERDITDSQDRISKIKAAATL
jgi:membrane protein involved in colicin uptake